MYKFNTETLEYEKVNLFPLGAKIGAIILGTIIFFGFTTSPRATSSNLSQEEKLIVIREYNEFSEKALVEKIDKLNFKFPYIILAQSYQETGHYKSSIFKKCKNLFGMKEAKVRSTLALGTQRGHAYYENWQDSVVDYALFYSTYLSDIKTEGEYYSYLEQYYAADPNYVTRLKAIIKNYKLKEKFI